MYTHLCSHISFHIHFTYFAYILRITIQKSKIVCVCVYLPQIHTHTHNFVYVHMFVFTYFFPCAFQILSAYSADHFSKTLYVSIHRNTHTHNYVNVYTYLYSEISCDVHFTHFPHISHISIICLPYKHAHTQTQFCTFVHIFAFAHLVSLRPPIPQHVRLFAFLYLFFW